MARNIFSEISDSIKQELGLSTAGSALVKEGDLPWGKNSKYKDSSVFFPNWTIDPQRWNKLYPYRLLVYDIEKNQILGTGDILANKPRVSQNIDAKTGLEYLSYTQEVVGGRWECVLPITPQQLSITTPYAINTSSTMRGVVEEHNGVKFKMISASGTTGIWTRRPTLAGAIKGRIGSAVSIFSGTLSATQDLAQNAGRVANIFNGDHPAEVPNPKQPGETDVARITDSEGGYKDNQKGYTTGYFQALYLDQFIERYVELKKDPANKHLRLVFDIPKQNRSFVVTPVSFSLQQSQQRPNHIFYNMQFKAWKKINLTKGVQPASSQLPDLNANTFQKIVNSIRETRRTLASATNLIKAVRGDIQGVFNIFRQTSLAVKDAGGFVFTAIDMPKNILQDARSTIEETLTNLDTAFDRPVSRGGSGRTSQTTKDSAILVSGASTSAKAGQAINAILDRQAANEGLSPEAVSAGALGQGAVDSEKTDTINNIFENPEENFDLFDEVTIDELTLTPEQQQAIDDEIENARLTTVEDFREYRAQIEALAQQIADNYGAGSQLVSDIYGYQTPRERLFDMTIEENEILLALYDSIQAYDLLISTKKFDDLNTESANDYVGGLAESAGIDFDDFPSKTLVPVPFGFSIEEIATRYMGNPDKWVEIATINSLSAPYIDEDGYVLSFITNGDGRQFTIDNSEDRLYLGQKIVLRSTTVPQFSRKIIDLEEINNGVYLVTVDGEADLDKLKANENATMQGYLPGTVNSQNRIYIPVNLPSQEDDRTFDIPNLDDRNLSKISKVDFLLTDNNDIAINSVGDLRFSSGLTNLIQALKLKILTKKGTLLNHLEYGLGLRPGISVADIDNGALADSINETIVSDPRFSGLERLSINLNGPELVVDLAVRVANDSGIVPINFNVRL